MCCETKGRNLASERQGFGCCCGPDAGHHFRSFITNKEKIERLQAYQEELKKELDGVDESIEDLKNG